MMMMTLNIGEWETSEIIYQPADKDYNKPIKTVNVFDNKNNYIEYESKGAIKTKFYYLKNILI